MSTEELYLAINRIELIDILFSNTHLKLNGNEKTNG